MSDNQTLQIFSNNNLFMSSMQDVIKLAEFMANSKITIPKHLRNNVGDCLAIILQARQWNMNPFSVAQKTFIINDVLCYEAQLVSAIINNNAPIQKRLNYEFYGSWENVIGKVIEKTSQKGFKYRVLNSTPEDEKDVGVKVYATFKGENSPRILNLGLRQVLTRNSTLWAEDPKQQLSYLATKRWARLFCPDIILGVYTPDEAEEFVEVEAKKLLTNEIESAILQYGLSLRKENGIAIVEGNTFEHSKILKELGFIFDNNSWCINYEENSIQSTPVIDVMPQSTQPQFDFDENVPNNKTLETKPQNIQAPKEPTKDKKSTPAIKLFNFIKQNGITEDNDIKSFVQGTLNVTKKDVDKIENLLKDEKKLIEQINSFLNNKNTVVSEVAASKETNQKDTPYSMLLRIINEHNIHDIQLIECFMEILGVSQNENDEINEILSNHSNLISLIENFKQMEGIE